MTSPTSQQHRQSQQHPVAVAVARSVTVEADRDTAFDVFTTGFDTWWNRSHHIGHAEMAAAVIEPRAGGRWYERGVDGSECDWGRVAVWEPPGRLVLLWQIDAAWQFDPSLETEVEVTFTEEAPGRTRVDLQHRHLERMGSAAETMRAAFESEGGWLGHLRAFATRCRSDAG